ALSPEAKIGLAKGAEAAGTAICSGEGGMLPEEQEACSRYLFELGSARFGFRDEVLAKVQAFHFKAGQAAKTGVGGHLPGDKVDERIAEVRGIDEGEDAISPPTFENLDSPADFAKLADEVREKSGGIPIGFKMSAQHVENDLDFAMQAGADYVILDGRGGGTGAAPQMLRDHISVPLIAALPRARKWLDKNGHGDVTLIATGGLRTPPDFIKALALGADAIALANSAIQAIGCVAARICNTNNCPSGVATQDEELRKRLDPDKAGERLTNFFHAVVHLMKLYSRACGHGRLADFTSNDLTSWKPEVSSLTGVRYAGDS
ncbi:MAG: FMN-binding glutamate synthase family protein, partial [Planctomycetota bacterium]